MSTEFKIQKATRKGVIPLIGLYGESGTGKTMSALLLARGLVGPSGDIHMIDTESRRGSLYADVIPGGFSVLDLETPFTPARYIQALEAIYAAGAKVGVIDSMSHEWELGVLDMAAENEERSKRPGLHNWKTPKFEHAKLVQFLLRSPIPIICCIRAKHKTKQRKDEKGKTVIVKDEFASPIQADDFIFEMTAHAEVLQDHSINLTKCSHPELRKCFPVTGPLGIEHGELIAKWCSAGGQSAQPSTSDDAKSPKAKLWKLTEKIHNGDPKTLETYLISHDFIEPGGSLSSLTPIHLRAICTQIEKEMAA
jgi:hypothetical protein